MRLASLALALLVLGACSKNIQTKDAIKEAVVAYVDSRQTQTGLDMSKLNVDVVTMNFGTNEAHATVAFNLKSGEGGMQMAYDLDRKGDKWVVRAGKPILPSSVTPTLPPNHPAVQGGGLPAGHPPVGSKE